MTGQAALQGHWRREWIRAPWFEDHSTRVHWLQAGELFADLRIPAERPDVRGLSALSELPARDLSRLLEAEGFAGHTTVQDGRCTWHRHINWHGVPPQADIGQMSWDADGALIEDGVLSEYRELWRREEMPVPQVHQVRAGTQTGLLIDSGSLFVLAMGPVPAGDTTALRAALAAGERDEAALHAQFESEYLLGHWDGRFGIAALSTNPLHEGHVALERGDDYTWHALAFDGRETARSLDPVQVPVDA